MKNFEERQKAWEDDLANKFGQFLVENNLHYGVELDGTITIDGDDHEHSIVPDYLLTLAAESPAVKRGNILAKLSRIFATFEDDNNLTIAFCDEGAYVIDQETGEEFLLSTIVTEYAS